MESFKRENNFRAVEFLAFSEETWMQLESTKQTINDDHDGMDYARA